MADLPIDQMLRDADEAWRISEGVSGTYLGALLGDLSCHVRALADALERAGRWIAVDEAMPVVRRVCKHDLVSDDVLIHIADRVFVARFYVTEAPASAGEPVHVCAWHETVSPYAAAFPIGSVTHWQPLLPPLTKEA